ncbi:MAG: hypothetical protein IKN62_05640 [Elusimicrobia bacterium]|nr:hypothetical protein [Elusimicrobiota bacterium]
MAKKTEGTNVKFNGISFRLNEVERRIINKNADKAGLTPSLYAKKQALEGKLKIMFSDKIGQEIIASLVRIEDNIKQINNAINNSVESQFSKIQNDLDIIMDFIFLQKKPKKKQIKEVSPEPVEEKSDIEIFGQPIETTTNPIPKIPQIPTKIPLNKTQTENTIKTSDENSDMPVKLDNSSKSNILVKYYPPDNKHFCEYCGSELFFKYDKTTHITLVCCPKAYHDEKNFLLHTTWIAGKQIRNDLNDWIDWEE